MPGSNSKPRPGRLPRRRDLPPGKDQAPIWSVIWRCLELNMAALAGAISGLLLTGLAFGLLAAAGGGLEALYLGVLVWPFAMAATALAFALLVFFGGRPRR
jgi:hypothetical protein